MRVYVDCVGCEQRQLDAQRIIDYLAANSISLAEDANAADWIVLVTCAVDQTSEHRSLARLEELLQQGPELGRVVVGGCLPLISPSTLAKYPVGATFSPRSLDDLDEVLGATIAVPMADIPHPNMSIFDGHGQGLVARKWASARDAYDAAKRGFKIVVDDGCLLDCSYCVIKYATGQLKSKPLETVVNEFLSGVARGASTAMIMGGDTGAYGWDIGVRLHHVLEAILQYDTDCTLFIHDFNVNWLIRDIEAYLNVLIKGQRRVGAINFPIQSGSDKILRRMKRPYTAQKASDALTQLRKYSPAIALGTHIIVGFPGETDEDFALTLALLKEVDFDFMSCFPYSEHHRANSSRQPEKVSPDEIRARLQQIQLMFGERAKIFSM